MEQIEKMISGFYEVFGGKRVQLCPLTVAEAVLIGQESVADRILALERGGPAGEKIAQVLTRLDLLSQADELRKDQISSLATGQENLAARIGSLDAEILTARSDAANAVNRVLDAIRETDQARTDLEAALTRLDAASEQATRLAQDLAQDLAQTQETAENAQTLAQLARETAEEAQETAANLAAGLVPVTGATAEEPGQSGLVPAPQAGGEFSWLSGGGIWRGEANQETPGLLGAGDKTKLDQIILEPDWTDNSAKLASTAWVRQWHSRWAAQAAASAGLISEIHANMQTGSDEFDTPLRGLDAEHPLASLEAAINLARRLPEDAIADDLVIRLAAGAWPACIVSCVPRPLRIEPMPGQSASLASCQINESSVSLKNLVLYDTALSSACYVTYFGRCRLEDCLIVGSGKEGVTAINGAKVSLFNLTFSGSFSTIIKAYGASFIEYGGSGNYQNAAATDANMVVDMLSYVRAFASMTGSVNGKRYAVGTNSLLQTSQAGPNYFPGTVAGTTGSGGVYL